MNTSRHIFCYTAGQGIAEFTSVFTHTSTNPYVITTCCFIKKGNNLILHLKHSFLLLIPSELERLNEVFIYCAVETMCVMCVCVCVCVSFNRKHQA
jgi:hypothetical protein